MPTGQITSWSQRVGTQTPSVFSLAYDLVDQLTAASVSEGGNVVKTFGYSYDAASNRLTEQVDTTTREFSYNALNQLTSIEGDDGPEATYEWDAEQRLVSVTSGNQTTQFTYDGLGRRVGIRQMLNGAEVSDRRFLWCGDGICEERTSAGSVVKRFFPQGMTVEAGVSVGKYFFTRDHLSSVRELIDDAGSTRARFDYEPYGVQVQIAGDLDSDFGFTGHFYDTGTALCLARYRAYDPKRAHWISRDQFPIAEAILAPSLYAYAGNNPVNFVDLTGQYEAPAAPVVAPVVVVVAGSSLLGPVVVALAFGAAGLWSALHPGPAPGPTSGTGPSGSGGGLSPAPAPAPGGGTGPETGSGGGTGGGYRDPAPPGPQYPECAGQPGYTATEKCCRQATGFRWPSDSCPPNDPGKQNFDECMSENGF